MRVCVLGATGFIGRPLVARMLRSGHQVVALARSPERARAKLGADVHVEPLPQDPTALVRALDGTDAIVNLAGEPILGGPWTTARRSVLRESRVGLAERVADAVAACAKKPATLIALSAVGYYGDRGDDLLDEASSMGSGFLAELCADWERASSSVSKAGVRTTILRMGVVLGREGGALSKMLPPFRVALGARVGTGRQSMPWIHVVDAVELIVRALEDDRYFGVFNATGPSPVTNQEFSRALGVALRRPVFLVAPTPVLKLALGGAASVLLSSQRAVPRRALDLGFEFRFPRLADALDDLLVDLRGVEIGPAPREKPTSAYLASRPADFLLEQKTLVQAPLPQVFAFFSRPANLGLMTPPSLSFEIIGPSEVEMERGAVISYEIRIGPLPMRWRTAIEAWSAEDRFVDVQEKGPYRSWWHEHRFEEIKEGTMMTDRVFYSVPFGPVGRIAHAAFVRPMLKRIFAYRADLASFLFGGP